MPPTTQPLNHPTESSHPNATMPAKRPNASTPSRARGVKTPTGGVSKRTPPQSSSVFDRVGSGLRAFGSNAMTGLNSKMRAFGSNANRRQSQGARDLRARVSDRFRTGINARLGDARGSDAERWPRGQIVGVDDDDSSSGNLRRRISSGSRATTHKKVKKGGGSGGGGDLRGAAVSSGEHPKLDRGVRQLLRRLQLEKFAPIFAKEEIDMHSLRAMRDKDFHALKIPMGPKLKLREAIRR